MCSSDLDHRPHNVQHLPNLRSPVNEIPEEDHFALGVFINALDFLVTKRFQQMNKFVSVAVNVANQIVHGRVYQFIVEFSHSQTAAETSGAGKFGCGEFTSVARMQRRVKRVQPSEAMLKRGFDDRH